MSRQETIAIVVLCTIAVAVIGVVCVNKSKSHRESVGEELSRQFCGVVIDRRVEHDMRLWIKSDTGFVVSMPIDADLQKVVKIGDSLIKKANSPYCLLIRNGQRVGYYWYAAIVGIPDVGADTIPPLE
jgi:hypothetical protein